MEPSFWHARWQRGEIGWHADRVNAHLRVFWPALALPVTARVFVPLCGKSRDLLWLVARGHEVIGVELSELAVAAVFAENAMLPSIIDVPPFRQYRAGRLTLFCGDFFHLTPALLGPVAAVFDRAALVALPPEQRARYAALMLHLVDAAPMLVIAYEYDQTQMAGPPFAVSGAEIARLYGARYRPLALTCQVDDAWRRRGVERMVERVWWLEPRQ